ncbi:tryptophan-rich sensory protein [Sphingorhabdus lutea]|uniref:Tryptophan-rich sensory protein n=1 Tax=Sphingorhabdus lutea TaxID=1913578 RepID=A0A1L3JAD6_9SPHN|nr:TspO/MBR family protein [Sphingorhabdus lutea]APG62092.1 tryptophan-rich sensory protein [Sphingorhabdus lutea]
MRQLASPQQLKMSLLRWALFIVPTILFLGFLSGAVSGSGEENSWFQMLERPAAQPPGWVFPIAWTILYAMIAFAFALILNARGAKGRGLAIILFLMQLALNLAWSPLFFGGHQITYALYLIICILGCAIATTFAFGKIRKLAAWLMVPYLAWLSFATLLNYQIDMLNPDAETLYAPAATSIIE